MQKACERMRLQRARKEGYPAVLWQGRDRSTAVAQGHGGIIEEVIMMHADVALQAARKADYAPTEKKI